VGGFKDKSYFEKFCTEFSLFKLPVLQDKDVWSSSVESGFHTGIASFAFKKQAQGHSNLAPAVFQVPLT
jgi:hypothetical protein